MTVVVVAIDFAIVVDVDWAHKTPRKLKLIELQSVLTNAEALPNTQTDGQDSHTHTNTNTHTQSPRESGATLGPSAKASVHLKVTRALHLHALSKNICVYLCANSRVCVYLRLRTCVCVCDCVYYICCLL